MTQANLLHYDTQGAGYISLIWGDNRNSFCIRRPGLTLICLAPADEHSRMGADGSDYIRGRITEAVTYRVLASRL